MTTDFKAISTRLKNAWNALPETEKIKLQPLIDNAHEQFMLYLSTGKGETSDTSPHQLLMVKSVLDLNNEGLAEKAFSIYKEELPVHIDGEGNIWGVGKYEQLDPGWLEAVAIYLEYRILGKYHPFPSSLSDSIPIPDDVTIAMAGDWGTGNWGTETNPAPSTKIIKAITDQSPDYTIHLGDVYYAGTKSEEEDKLISIWPVRSTGAFTLNSNHEMYSGAKPYFEKSLGTSFPLQNKQSFFALENTNWVIVGLDSAYFDESLMYMHGSLGNQPQLSFLNKMALKGKKVIILTHHNGLKDQKDGNQKRNDLLWSQVMNAIPPGNAPVYWYFGHIHTGVVYAPQIIKDKTGNIVNTVFCRCLGHGSIPWGYASDLEAAERNGTVLWFEKTNASDPNNKNRVYNGFVTLKLNGPSVTEFFYNENGDVSWPINC
jgi:hypothetical protein